MSAGLVAYDCSDSESEEEQQTQQIPAPACKNGENSQPAKESSSSSVLHNLPAIQNAQSKASASTLLSKESIKRTATGRIQIKAPVLIGTQLDSDDDDEDEEAAMAAKKRVKASDKGSGLFSMLPDPKRKTVKAPQTTNGTSTTNKLPVPAAFVPKIVSDRKKLAATTPRIADSDDSDDDGSFFFTKHRPLPASVSDSSSLPLPQSSRVEMDADDEPMYGPARPTVDLEDAQSSSSSAHNANDDFAYKRFIASKFGEEAPDKISIVDFDMGQHLKDNKEWIKNISKESETIEDSQIGAPTPNAAAKRRNQITYLAYQAKKREVELKNQWAANKQTMQQSRSRYGF